MSGRIFSIPPGLIRAALVVMFVLAGLACKHSPADDTVGAEVRKANLDAEVFGLTRVWKINITLSNEEYEAMQPPPLAFPGAPPGASPPPAAKPRKPRESERNLFGMEFPWARGELTTGGTTYQNVAFRYAGNASYMASAAGLKRSFKVDLERFAHQELHGLRSISLQSGALDPSKAREALAFALFRAAGVPAPRTAFAEVTLTVPGKHDEAYLGLYTLVEPVDRTFVEAQFHTAKGLLLKPERLRGIDDLGEDWEKYKGQYQPQSVPTREQSERVVKFARLIHRADDKQFRGEIVGYLDVDAFLRFMAVNALLANADNFFTLGYNYSLYLHPETNKFQFIPGEQEMAFANFLMMGTSDQLMDMSLVRPYTGENKLVDRLLAIKEVSERYQQLLKELTATAFTKEKLLRDTETIVATTRESLARESKATAVQGGAGGGLGPPPGMFAPPPDLRTFAEKRLASVVQQLAGKRNGYSPKFSFGPPPGGGSNQGPITEKNIQNEVKAPADFEVTLYAAPPKLGYPVAVSAAADDAVFIAVDEQGSLGRTAGGGKVFRCVDKDGDGKAEQINVFAKMEHPRGLIYQDGSLWVLHPPLLSVFHDDNNDGTSDRQEVLVTGLTTNQIDLRGGDHTTNGIRMGIDGWIYIAVGDYGFHCATGKDGNKLSQRGGGILRVRPDGTELEVFATGLRNPFDIALDPYLNLFTRDNTNDGAGWDVRVSHLVQSAQYGYTQLYANYPDEIMPPLGQFGQGGGTGSLFIQDPRWPEKFRDMLYTGDWGRSEVYRHPLANAGASFRLTQQVFLSIPRPTGMDIDGRGRLFVASWRGGEASVYVGPQVGFVARVIPRGLKPEPDMNFKTADLGGLIGALAAPSPVPRLQAQCETLKRGRSAPMTRALVDLAADSSNPLYGRLAAIFTLKQLDGPESHPAILKLADDPATREFALRALTDRKTQLKGLDRKPFVAALADESPRVRAQALISLGRLKDTTAAPMVLPLTARPKGSEMPSKAPVHGQPDPDRVIPHLAVRTLVSLNAADACLEALDGPNREGALRALRSMHEPRVVEGLIKKLATVRSSELRLEILTTLIRLYHREGEYNGSWWGIRPDSTGPYYDRQPWELSDRIGSVIKHAVLDSEPTIASSLRAELVKHQVQLDGLPSASDELTRGLTAETKPVVIPTFDPKNADQLGNISFETATQRTLQFKGDSRSGKALFDSQSCRSCHTDADGQAPKGPHLVDIGKRYRAEEMVESILKPSAKIAQGYESYLFAMTNGQSFTGFVVSEGASVVLVRDSTGVQHALKQSDIEARRRQEPSAMPEGIVANLTPKQLADLIAYLQSLK